MRIEDLADAPNPQFVRPGWTDLTGTWRFRFDDDDRGIRERWFGSLDSFDREITVPYPPESELSGINDKSFHPVSWYARTFEDIRDSPGQRLIIQFGAVDYLARVWVDGVQVGEHRGGHTPFALDITDAMEDGQGEHLLVVRAFDDPIDAEQPRGKQDWQPEPHVIWYHRTSGIWQPVWLEVTPAVRILNVRWQFDPARWMLDYEIELSKTPAAGSTVGIALSFDGDAVAAITVAASARVLKGRVGLDRVSQTGHPGRLVWSPDRPSLVNAHLTLETAGGTDTVETYLGLRTIELSGRRFLINGRSVFLRFVLNQGYWPESQLAAPSPGALKREVELIKELGFNGARNHQKIEDPRFLYWADRLGVMLWGEIANAFTHSERAIDRHSTEWREAVIRDRNHPSVIAWVPFNESWGISEVGYSPEQQESVKAAYHRTHALDGTRPVVGNDGWENVAGDILTVHDYSWDPAVLSSRYGTEDQLEQTCQSFFPGSRRMFVSDFDPNDKPVMVTEFGGVSFAPDAGEEWFGYGKVRNADEFRKQYGALTLALHDSEVLCGFCYTQLTDTEQETNGLLTEKREPKIPLETISAITRGESPASA